MQANGDKWQEWREGWKPLAGAILSAGAGISILGAVNGFFLKPLTEEFGWSRGQASMSSGAMLLTALLMPLMAIIVDRVGPRRVILTGGILFAIAYAALASMSGSIWVYAGIMLFVGLAAGPATALLVVTRPLVSAFTRSRGLAISLGMSGAVFICLPLLPLLQHVIATEGWRTAYAMMAPLTLVMAILSFLLLPGRLEPLTRADQPEAPHVGGVSFKQAVAQSRFWLLLLSTICISMVGGAFSTQLQPLLSDRGVPGATAALMGSLYAMAVVTGRLFAGALLDRFWPPLVGALCIGTAAIGASLFMVAADELFLLGAGIALVGAAAGAEADMMAFFVARYFGLRAFNTLLGVVGMTFGLALAVGGMGAGFLFDAQGSYDLMLVGGVVLSLISSLALLASGRRVADP